MIFVYLPDPSQNVERVRIRVAKGGHDVPEDRIRARWSRSFGELSWHLQQADRVDVFENAGAEPRRVLTKTNGTLSIFHDLPEVLVEAIERSSPGFRQIYEAEER